MNGASRHPFDSFNLAAHVDDRPEAVAWNRARLREQLNLPSEPAWLQQQHGNTVIKLEREQVAPADSPAPVGGPAPLDSPTPVDGAYTATAGRVCAVLTADCIPLLLCNRDGTEVAALHVGWRGLCKRIIKHGLSMFDAAPHELLGWTGPYIHQQNYEVGADVVSACSSIWTETRVAILPSRPNHWFLDLEKLVKAELHQQGVEDIYGCNLCTFARKDLFYSWRRDGVTGRMATLIWLSPCNE